MNNEVQSFDIVTITLNPAIDRTVAIANFQKGAVNRVEREHAYPGGKGVNVACAVADYGHRVAVSGFLGRENAALFETLFAQKQIADQFVRVAGKTRESIKITDAVQNQTTDINFPGARCEPSTLETLQECLGKIGAKWAVLAGSLPPGVDPHIYAQLIAGLKGRGIQVLLDTSGEPLRLAIPARPNVIKPNIHELEALLGEKLPTETAVLSAARKLVSDGIKLVVVSMGKAGACFVNAVEVVIARSPPTKIQSTVGAGDAMVAGLLCGQLRNLPLAEAAQLATAFALDALSRVEPGLGSPETIQFLASRVPIEHPLELVR